MSNALAGNEMWIIVEWDDMGIMYFKARDFALVIPKGLKTRPRYRDWEYA